eukprot:995600_1
MSSMYVWILIGILQIPSKAQWESNLPGFGMPKKDSCMAIGYCDETSTISILGGVLGNLDIMKFYPTNNSFSSSIDNQTLSIGIQGFSQFWTQIDQTLFIITGGTTSTKTSHSFSPRRIATHQILQRLLILCVCNATASAT